MKTLLKTITRQFVLAYGPGDRHFPPFGGKIGEETWKELAMVIREYYEPNSQNPYNPELQEAACEICRGSTVTLTVDVFSDGTIKLHEQT